MQKRPLFLSCFIALVIVACNLSSLTAVPSPIPPTPTAEATPPPVDTPGPFTPATPTTATAPTEAGLPSLSIILGSANQEQGIRLDYGGDVDTALATKGEANTEVRQTGNGEALPAPDGNATQDYYIQFNVEDDQISSGEPSARLRVEVDYFDEGDDTFILEYDGRFGAFWGGGAVAKTNSLTIKTAAFYLCDAYFNNRANGADFRLSDNGDGAEWIAAVRVIALPDAGAQTIHVDDFGANPIDEQPDSQAIQAALDSTCSQDTVVFTSGVDAPDYKGYWIDQTLFLTGMSSKHDLTFTASDPTNHALLKATADLQGFVARLFARSRVNSPGAIDNIDFGFIDIHGGRDLRVCHGADGIANGADDNWGSWLPECSLPEDPWCLPGILGIDGGANWEDLAQDYVARPEEWSTGIVIHDLVLQQGECGTALGFFCADCRIDHVTIDTAGDHVHGAGCAFTDADGDFGAWSDGITASGPGLTIRNNTVINPSDIGIVGMVHKVVKW